MASESKHAITVERMLNETGGLIDAVINITQRLPDRVVTVDLTLNEWNWAVDAVNELLKKGGE